MPSYRRINSTEHFRARSVVNVPPRYSTQEVTEGLARVLTNKYLPFKQPSVALSEDSGTSERAARNHLSGVNAMNLTDFFNACQRIPELKAWGAKMMGMATNLDPLFEAELHRLMQAYYAMETQRSAE